MGLLFAICRSVLNAWLGQTLWAWFMVPLGLPPVSLAAFYGIDTFVTWITFNYADGDAMVKQWGEAPDMSKMFGVWAVVSIATLGMGALAHFLVGKGF